MCHQWDLNLYPMFLPGDRQFRAGTILVLFILSQSEFLLKRTWTDNWILTNPSPHSSTDMEIFPDEWAIFTIRCTTMCYLISFKAVNVLSVATSFITSWQCFSWGSIHLARLTSTVQIWCYGAFHLCVVMNSFERTVIVSLYPGWCRETLMLWIKQNDCWISQDSSSWKPVLLTGESILLKVQVNGLVMSCVENKQKACPSLVSTTLVKLV